MTIATTIALMSAALAVYVAALSRRFALAPGWGDQRWFSLAALTVAIYGCLAVFTATTSSDVVVIWCSRGEIAVAGIHIYAWIRYSDFHLGVRPGRVRLVVERLPLAISVVALIPGGVFHDAVRSHAFSPLGLTYKDVVPTLFGEVAFAFELGVIFSLALRYAFAWRRGVRHAAVHLFALLYMCAVVTNDALVASGVLPTPYLINLAFIMPIAAVAYSLTARFASDAHAHRELRARLESIVEERTQELAAAQEQLLRSEKLAALGKFAAGVAHEVNNPASAASANLHYLIESCSSGSWPDDAQECLVDAVNSIERIARQLRDAGRLAAAPVAVESVPLAKVARESVRTSQARCGKRVRLAVDVADELHARAQESMLVQVIVNLVVNGIQAIPRERQDGCVTVRGERADGRVRLLVEDDGVGMTPEVQRHAFEPFFSTKLLGDGTGLGLAVSRGLVQSLGGDLRLESVPGRGTRAVVELPEAPPVAVGAAVTPNGAPAGPRRRVLLVDDDPTVLRALERVLASRFQVKSAQSVAEALSSLDGERFDAVLCDVMMPDGGGERLYQQLAQHAPETAKRIVFITGGASNEEARRFLAAQPQPALEKPLDLSELAAAVARVVS